MSITREQVADLREGDVVELREDGFPDVVTRGPLREDGGTLWLARRPVRRDDGRRAAAVEDCTLTVVSRAPRPLYVNYPRPEPVPGDVVRSEDDSNPWTAWRDTHDAWLARDRHVIHPSMMPDRLRLLVDGETGQVVP